MIRLSLLFLGLVAVGTLSTAFAISIFSSFAPQEHGFFHRFTALGLRYGLCVGLVCAVIFFLVYRSNLTR